MSNVVFVDKLVKTRKEHLCSWCGEAIPKAAKVRFTSGIYDDGFYRSYMHDECDVACTASLSSGDEYMFYDNQRGVSWQDE